METGCRTDFYGKGSFGLPRTGSWPILLGCQFIRPGVYDLLSRCKQQEESELVLQEAPATGNHEERVEQKTTNEARYYEAIDTNNPSGHWSLTTLIGFHDGTCIQIRSALGREKRKLWTSSCEFSESGGNNRGKHILSLTNNHFEFPSLKSQLHTSSKKTNSGTTQVSSGTRV